MRPELEQFLAQVRGSLDLPAKKADLLVEELRSHLLADYEERVRAGKSEEDAAREVILEMGDVGEMVEAWRVEHAEARFSPLLHNTAAAMLSVVGFFTVYIACDAWRLPYLADRLFPLASSSTWIYGHFDLWAQETIVQFLPLLVVGVLVGRVSRGRGWLLVLFCWLWFWTLQLIPDILARHITRQFLQPLAQGIALLLGAYSGQRLRLRSPRARRYALWAPLLVLVLLCLTGFSRTAEGFAVTAALAGYAGLGGLLTWGVLFLWRRWAPNDEASPAG